MKDVHNILDAELEYAVKMVRAGYATVDQAAQVCGVRVADLQARLEREPTTENDGRGYRMLMSR